MQKKNKIENHFSVIGYLIKSKAMMLRLAVCFMLKTQTWSRVCGICCGVELGRVWLLSGPRPRPGLSCRPRPLEWRHTVTAGCDPGRPHLGGGAGR